VVANLRKAPDSLIIMAVAIARNIGAGILGFVAGFVFVIGTEAFSEMVYPFPPVDDPKDFETCMIAHVARYPAWVLACVVPLWSLAIFSTVWTATRLGTNRNPLIGIVVGGLLYVAAICNLTMLPYPIWFKAGIILALPLAGFWGFRLARGKNLGIA
jgi:hypothetical protein